jgi:hypothetical protein
MMTVSDLDILRSAHVHLERYGDQAVAKAREMFRTLKDRGGNEQRRHLAADHRCNRDDA